MGQDFVRAKPRFIPLTALLAGLIPAILAWAGEYDDIAVLAESESEITFLYSPGPLTWSADADGVIPRLPGATVDRETSDWPIPGRIVYLALPPGTDAVLADLVSTGPVETGRHGPLTSAPLSAGLPPRREPVVVDEIFTLRGQRLARLILHPLAYLSAQGDYQLTSAMTVRVRYFGGMPAGSIPAAPKGVFDHVLRAICLNSDRIDAWRQAEHPALARALSDPHPFAGATEWIAIHVTEGGVTQVTGANLQQAGVSLAGISPQSIRLFGGPGRQLSTQMTDPAPALTEVAIRVNGGEDGTFDAGDSFEFYAQSLNRWEIVNDTQYIDRVHRYDRENVYWLALSGTFEGDPKRITTQNATEPGPGAIDLFSATVRARHERDLMFRSSSLGFIDSYYTWYWQNSQSTTLSQFAVQNLDPGTPAVVEIGSYWISPRLSVNGVPADTLPQRPLGEDDTRIARYRVPALTPTAVLRIDFDVFPRGYYLDYYSIEYQRRLTLSGGAFAFPLPPQSNVYAVTLAGVTTPAVWDVTNPSEPAAYTGLTVTGNTARFAVDQTSGGRRTLLAFEPGHKRSPTRLRRLTPPNLHTPALGADYIVIGPRAFEPAMSDFMAYRGARDDLVMRYAALEDIYDAFSLGVKDPLAIRRFLRQAFLAWPGDAPVYALLVGDGTYDFLGNTGGLAANFVPPYIAIDDNSASDENFVYFGNKQVLDSDGGDGSNPFPDMIIGRWPVKSAADITAITAKIKQYESAENLGPWRSRVVMVADDEFGDRNAGSVTEIFHIRDAEDISRRTIPSRLDIRKIYMTEYPFDNPGCHSPQATGCRKPAVKEAIIQALNSGAAVFDYLGHGNKDLLAHERAFERVTDLPRLTNAGMPTAVLTFSCSIGFFDDPGSEGMSEEWLRMPGVGAVTVISATRLVTAGANAALNDKVFELLLSGQEPRVGVALYTGKLIRQYVARCTVCPALPCPCPNDRRYVLFGDPAMRLGTPDNRIVFKSVQPETLSALQLTEVRGMITDPDGTPLNDFTGTASITVRDAPRSRTYRVNETLSMSYDLAGGVLFRGDVPVANGQFEFGFIVPKDVAYGRPGARILAHAYSATQMAGGAADSIWIAGSTGVLTDTTGPEIELFTVAGERITNGFLIPLGTEIVANLSDPSGINLTGAPGHRLELFVDGSPEPLADLTDLFTYTPGAYDRGEARLTLTGIEPGRRLLTLKAWDNANNSSQWTAEIDVAPAGTSVEFRVDEFLNHPNPFENRTRFYFTATREFREAKIRIFTLAGRLIWQLNGAADGVAEWDGADLDGDQVGNGVYLAQIEVKGELNENGRKVERTAYKETKVVLSR